MQEDNKRKEWSRKIENKKYFHHVLCLSEVKGMDIRMKEGVSWLHYDWHFKLADAFPLARCLEAVKDPEGRNFFEESYAEGDWEVVGLPHTFNDKDLFVAPIEDAGSGQKRTFACYRRWIGPVENLTERKVFLEFEGVRQTCYLYEDKNNLLAIATDNTSSRNLDFFSAETPNAENAEPGSFITSLTKPEEIPAKNRGVGYFWNCNDFNPSVGGLTRSVRLHIKPKVYLTLPLYSNLRTKGCYIYGTDYDIAGKKAVIHAEAEVRNESGRECRSRLKVTIKDETGKDAGSFFSKEMRIPAVKDAEKVSPKSILPKDAYHFDGEGFVPAGEEDVCPTCTESLEHTLIEAKECVEGLHFWNLKVPYLYQVRIELYVDGEAVDSQEIETGFRKVSYDGTKGLCLNEEQIWLTGYAQRATNEWPAIGCAPQWLKDQDAVWIRESNANHIRFMHVAGAPADIRAFDRYGVVCTQPAGDKERENFGRQWDQRMELMRDVILYFRNHPSIFFWEAGNNSISKEHMREMRLLKQKLDPMGGRFMGCRTINTEEVVVEAEYVGTMLNRHAARFQSERMPITETEYLREEAPRRIWDDFTPPDYDYDNKWLGQGGRKEAGADFYDLTSEDLGLRAAGGFAEFFHDRMGGASGRNLYSAAAALCWTDSAQHGRQSYSENARMSGRVDPARVKKQSFEVFRVLQSTKDALYLLGHWNYPPMEGENYCYANKVFDGHYWVKDGTYSYRNPKDKTVYCIASYGILAVELYINGCLEGRQEKPERGGFVFAFPHIDITKSGFIEAVGYNKEGVQTARYRIETTGPATKICLEVHTAGEGLLADGTDIAYVDVSVVDAQGRICPLENRKITFSLEGEGIFLGGYNSGRFNGNGRKDSVIHTDHVYAECGTNRVFIRSTKHAGKILLKAHMEEMDAVESHALGVEEASAKEGKGAGIAEKASAKTERSDNIAETKARRKIPDAWVMLESIAGEKEEISKRPPSRLEKARERSFAENENYWEPIPQADILKYEKPDKLYCKVLINGQEPDTRGTLSVVDHDGVFSPVLYILEALHRQRPDLFDWSYEDGVLEVNSGDTHAVAQTGHTCILVNGEENLMNGQPFFNANGTFLMEIGPLMACIHGIHAWYDDKIQVFRIEY